MTEIAAGRDLKAPRARKKPPTEAEGHAGSWPRKTALREALLPDLAPRDDHLHGFVEQPEHADLLLLANEKEIRP